jgi:acetolactate synthase-1/2/3 large subunit
MKEKLRVADYLISALASRGVKHIFMVPGGGAMHLNDALAQSSDVSYVPNHHEQASSIAAEAYSRITNSLGVAMVTSGPGGTNAITGVVGAWIESVPLLVLSGQVKRADLQGNSGVRQKGVQEVDIVSIVSSITKYAVTVMEPNDIRYHLEKALHLAQTGRRGPVWLDLPLDVQGAVIDPEELRGYDPEAEEDNRVSEKLLADKITTVLALLKEARRPLILAGHGVRLAGAAESFRTLYEKLNIPVATTWNAMDLIPAGHKLSVGSPGAVAQRTANFAVQNCDLLIAIGARLDNVVTAYNAAKFGRDAKKVIVDVDPAELAKFDMPIELSIESDARVFIERMLGAIESEDSRRATGVDRTEWLERAADWKKRYPAGGIKRQLANGVISHYDLIRSFSEELPENSLIVTGSSGLAVEMFYIGFQNKPGQRIFLTSGLGAMGYGLPAMIGAGLAYGNKPFVGIESDGSLQMNLQELSTIRQFNLPVRIFIMNNNGYASIRVTQRNYFAGRHIGTGPEGKLYLPDVLEVAKAFGIPAIRISNMSELTEKIRYTLEQPGPFICDVQLVPNEVLYPRVTSFVQPDGSMMSMPLEDMYPLLDREELRQNMLIPLEPASEKIVLTSANTTVLIPE